MDFGLDGDELVSCVACGLCLPHCPTYVVSGRDAESPRGRIALMQAVQVEGAPVTDEVVRSMQTCVQCRGCETACPSGVPFGRLMEGTRAALASAGRITGRWQRLGLAALARPRLLRAASVGLGLLQRLRAVPSGRLGLPDPIPLRRPPLRASGTDAFLFTGCVMDAWQRPVHSAVQAVIEATGAGVTPTGAAAPCCGALPAHAGLEEMARSMAQTTMVGLARLGGANRSDAPVLVDSAGCGAALSDYGRLLGTEEARRFSARVFDVHEWLALRLGRLPPPARKLETAVAVQDPCHLRHVQRAHRPVYEVLEPFVESVATLDDDGLCCGAGGAYSVLEPDRARLIRDRKLAALERSGATVVASANPGCSLHLAAAGLDVRHPLELVAEALDLT